MPSIASFKTAGVVAVVVLAAIRLVGRGGEEEDPDHRCRQVVEVEGADPHHKAPPHLTNSSISSSNIEELRHPKMVPVEASVDVRHSVVIYNRKAIHVIHAIHGVVRHNTSDPLLPTHRPLMLLVGMPMHPNQNEAGGDEFAYFADGLEGQRVERISGMFVVCVYTLCACTGVKLIHDFHLELVVKWACCSLLIAVIESLCLVSLISIEFLQFPPFYEV
jgi:hypothetical protein